MLMTAAPSCMARPEVATANWSDPILMVAVWAPVAPGFTSVIEPITAPVLSLTGVPTVKAAAVAVVSAPVPVEALGEEAEPDDPVDEDEPIEDEDDGGAWSEDEELDEELSAGAVDDAGGDVLDEGLVLAWTAKGMATARPMAA